MENQKGTLCVTVLSPKRKNKNAVKTREKLSNVHGGGALKLSELINILLRDLVEMKSSILNGIIII